MTQIVIEEITDTDVAVVEYVTTVTVETLGVPGRDGDGVNLFVFDQPAAASLWIVPHNLETYPSVRVLDFNGVLMLTGVTYLNPNLVHITLAYPTSGKAYLS